VGEGGKKETESPRGSPGGTEKKGKKKERPSRGFFSYFFLREKVGKKKFVHTVFPLVPKKGEGKRKNLPLLFPPLVLNFPKKKKKKEKKRRTVANLAWQCKKEEGKRKGGKRKKEER